MPPLGLRLGSRRIRAALPFRQHLRQLLRRHPGHRGHERRLIPGELLGRQSPRLRQHPHPGW